MNKEGQDPLLFVIYLIRIELIDVARGLKLKGVHFPSGSSCAVDRKRKVSKNMQPQPLYIPPIHSLA